MSKRPLAYEQHLPAAKEMVEALLQAVGVTEEVRLVPALSVLAEGEVEHGIAVFGESRSAVDLVLNAMYRWATNKKLLDPTKTFVFEARGPHRAMTYVMPLSLRFPKGLPFRGMVGFELETKKRSRKASRPSV